MKKNHRRKRKGKKREGGGKCIQAMNKLSSPGIQYEREREKEKTRVKEEEKIDNHSLQTSLKEKGSDLASILKKAR